MKITITSATGNVLSHENFLSISLMTESGQITILPHHEPLLSVVRPGILTISYEENGTQKTEEYATGGGVITITPDDVTIITGSLNSADQIEDADAIEKKKQEAKEMIARYNDENKTEKSMKELMDLEYQYLKYAAMQELVKNSSLRSGRK